MARPDPVLQPNAGAELVELAREVYRRGWALGTSGNFSIVVSREPLRLLITASGVDKGRLATEHLVEVDAEARALNGRGKPSDETRLHLAVAQSRRAGAVLHTHSIWGTVLSSVHAAAGGLALDGFEMLKGLDGVETHEHREWVPILGNSQNMAALAGEVQRVLDENPAAHGFLLRGHGLYTWGTDLAQAKRHLEILEFLLEVVAQL